MAALLIAPLVASVGGGRASAATDPASDGYSMYQLTRMLGVTAMWDRGYTGAGIDVAVIDTGVAPVAGLDAPGKVVHGPDLSFESQIPQLAHLDTNGHGTFMAGLIAGRDAGLGQAYSQAAATNYRGIAPDARIISLKVGVADGGVDVTQMIAAINWVVDHRDDFGLNIRVLNLSYGTNSRQQWLSDPLAHAAERAWRAGIVVVAASGNAQFQRGVPSPGLADPAFNPTILAVGGFDTKGTALLRDDRVGSYSARPTRRGDRAVDVVAPGTKVQGLRVPNSYIDLAHPEGRLGDRYFRGTGTSEAAAITSGVVALLLDQHPQLTPDQVKAMLRSSARMLHESRRDAQGQGALDAAALLRTPVAPAWPQPFPATHGLGSVEMSRGSDHLTLDGVVLQGEQDIFGMPFLPGTAGSSWVGGTWNGSVWTGDSWTVNAWGTTTWTTTPWTGSSWSGSSWSGSSWSGSSWSGSSWSGSSWSGSSWSGSSWSGSSWSGSSWSTAGWSGWSWG